MQCICIVAHIDWMLMCCAFRGMCCLQAHVQNALTLLYIRTYTSSARTLLLTISTHTEKKHTLEIEIYIKNCKNLCVALHLLSQNPTTSLVCMFMFILIIFKVIKLFFFSSKALKTCSRLIFALFLSSDIHYIFSNVYIDLCLVFFHVFKWLWENVYGTKREMQLQTHKSVHLVWLFISLWNYLKSLSKRTIDLQMT